MVRGVRAVLVFLVVIFCVLQTVFVVYKTSTFEDKIRADAVDGHVQFCINLPPNITGVCPVDINQSTAVENNTLLCQMDAEILTGTQPNYSAGSIYNGSYLEFTPISFGFTGMTFSINSSGFVTVYGNQSGIGSYYVPISVKDTSVCPLEAFYDYNFVIHDINDPPTLIRLLPSKVMPGKSTIVPFTLENYFVDVDGDNMSYSYFVNSSLVVKIDNKTSQVTIIAIEGVCDEQLLYFTATDEHNLSSDSNIVIVDVECKPEKPTTDGGGGGGPKCEPEWECASWSRCYINNTQSRECVDLNACDPDNLKRVFWRECQYIPTCYDGVQNNGETGIDCGGPCPSCSIETPVINATCEDGIKNQGETGIDCGGPCPACKHIESPEVISVEDENNLMTISMIVILSAGVMAVSYFIFRKEIKKAVAKVGWWLTRKRRKQILIKDEQREELLTRIKALEVKAKKIDDSIKSSSKMFLEYLDISRMYFDYAISLKGYNDSEIELALKKVKNRNLVKSMKIFIERQVLLEMSDVQLDKELTMYYIQDLRQLVLNTANYDKKDYSFIARTLPVDEEEKPLEQGKIYLYNATVALEFADVDSAKNAYYELLKIYELLDMSGKELIFDELTKLYNEIKYTLSWKELADGAKFF